MTDYWRFFLFPLLFRQLVTLGPQDRWFHRISRQGFWGWLASGRSYWFGVYGDLGFDLTHIECDDS